MFDVSFVELAVIALVALIVLGPEKLPRAARTVGFWMRKARQSWYSVRAELERELADEEMKRSVHEARQEIRGLTRDLDAATQRPQSTSTPPAPESTEAAPDKPDQT
jgi:sec-independent protein translocase protein TatB